MLAAVVAAAVVVVPNAVAHLNAVAVAADEVGMFAAVAVVLVAVFVAVRSLARLQTLPNQHHANRQHRDVGKLIRTVYVLGRPAKPTHISVVRITMHAWLDLQEPLSDYQYRMDS